MKNLFIIDPSSDFDCYVATRIIKGRITKSRYKAISNYVRKWNYNHSTPYGVSPQGYAYRCGCEHDCCGCLCGESLTANFTPSQVTLVHSQSFNY